MSAATVAAAARRALPEIKGVVISAGLMQRTVKVQVGAQQWNNQVKKHFKKRVRYLVHDPNSSLRIDDVVAITAGWSTSKNKRHVLKHIISAAGTPIEERPHIPTEKERMAEYEAKRAAKKERKQLKRERELMEGMLAKTEKRVKLLTIQAKQMLRIE